MAEQKKRYARGDAFLTLDGTVGTEPKLDKIPTKNGEMEVCSFRCVASPYRAGQAEPEDMWFSVRVVGSQAKFASGLAKGDVITARGGLSVRQYESKGVKGTDLILNVDSVANALRRTSSRKPSEGEESVETPVSAAVESTEKALF